MPRFTNQTEENHFEDDGKTLHHVAKVYGCRKCILGNNYGY